ncbi:hypothetical protein AB0F43_00190, partial [Kribbella sp. NPDC023972]
MPLVDLDDPEELRARWVALAAVAHATGFDRRWYADETGYHHQDETASFLRMARLDGGRAVLFGFHTQHSRTAGADLLAGSPDWIGQPEVRRLISSGELGFVYGAFNGTWARASYPGDPWQPLDDGFAPIGQWITSDEEAAGEMIEWVAEWCDYLGGLDELLPFGVQLIRTAGQSGITAEALGEFFDRFGIDPRSPVQPDLPAGVAAAADFNLAIGEQLADDPDTAEVSVVEDLVIGAPEGPEDEESYVVPPGISPFTGQPIDESVTVAPEPHYEQTPYRPARPVQDEYGVVEKKQGWLRRRKQDDGSAPPAPSSAAGASAPVGFQGGGPAPGTYLPEGEIGVGLPYGSLPSSEPPRVGGGVHDGEDFYASLFADAPAAAAYQQDPPADEQDWETAEQPAWSDRDATSEYNPFADDTAPAQPDREWVGGAWINGEWVENPTIPTSNQAPTTRGPAPAATPPAAAATLPTPTSATSPSAPASEISVPAPAATFPAPASDASLPAPAATPPAHASPPTADDDAPTAEIAAVVEPDPTDEEDEPASFTGPSPFAPAAATEPSNLDAPPEPSELPAHPANPASTPATSTDHLDAPATPVDPGPQLRQIGDFANPADRLGAPAARLDTRPDDANPPANPARTPATPTDRLDEPANPLGPGPHPGQPAAQFGEAANRLDDRAAPLDTRPDVADPTQPTASSEEHPARPDQPAARLDEPAGRLDEPVARLDEPAGRLDEPVARLDEPAGRLDEPVARL